MGKEKISVIIPIYKDEKYLDRCVQSVLKQSYANLEIILVDDGSPDKCPKMCDDYEKLDERIKVIHKENGGLSDARNVGVKASTGECIFFLDSDDYIDLNCLEILLNDLKNNDADVAVGGHVRFDDEKFWSENIISSNVEVLNRMEFLKRFCEHERVNLVTAWGKLFKREIIGDLLFPKGKVCEDEYLTFRFYDRAKRITINNSTLYKYYQREGSIMSSKSINLSLDEIDSAVTQLEYFKLQEPEIYSLMLKNRLYLNVYDLMKIYRNKEISKAEKKNYVEKIKFYYNDAKRNHIKLDGSFKLFFCLNFISFAAFIYKLRHPNEF